MESSKISNKIFNIKYEKYFIQNNYKSTQVSKQLKLRQSISIAYWPLDRQETEVIGESPNVSSITGRRCVTEGSYSRTYSSNHRDEHTRQNFC